MSINELFKEELSPNTKIDALALGLDPLFEDAARFVVDKRTHYNLDFQKEFNIDYARAYQLFNQLRDYNVIGPIEHPSLPRKIMDKDSLEELFMTLRRNRIVIASETDLANAWTDEYGVKYSVDGKRLLKAPQNIKDCSVREGTIIICNKAFANTTLESIVISDSVTIIGGSCFWYCKCLTSVYLPFSLLELGGAAFYHCTELTRIFIPEKVRKIGLQVFAYCNKLLSVVVDENNNYYDSRDDCNGIIESHSNTFYTGCSNSIIPEGVTEIGDHSFNYCNELTSIVIPGCVQKIGHQAFFGCENLREVLFQNGVEEIGSYAFMDNHCLCSVTFPKSLKTISEGAFEGCNIKTIYIPEGVEQIWSNPFKRNNPQSIVVDSNNTHYDSRNNCNAIIDRQHNVLITGSCSTVIPSSVFVIGEFAFEGCRGLTSIVIPEGVKVIGFNAFYGCESLFADRDIQNSLLSSFFESDECKGLSTVVIPNSLYRASGFVFGSNPNLKIIIPKGTREKYEKIFYSGYKDQLIECVKQTNC